MVSDKSAERKERRSMNLTKYERETIISYNEDTDKADVYTCSKSVMRKLDKLCEKYPDTYQRVSSDEYSSTYVCPISRVRFSPPPSEKQMNARRRAIEIARQNICMVQENPQGKIERGVTIA
jgi:hypothetical protein